MLKNLSIGKKLLVLILLPIIATLILGGININKALNTKEEEQILAQFIQLDTKISALVHESQKERGMTAGFLGSKGQNFASELPKQRQIFNQKRTALLNAINHFPAKDLTPHIKQKLDQALALMAKTDSIRSKVDTLTIPAKQAIAHYTQMNAQYIKWIQLQIKQTHNAEMAKQLVAYAAFLQSKERAGIERAVLTNTFAQDHFAPGYFPKFIRLVSEQDAYMGIFDTIASPELIAFKNKTLSALATQQVQAMRDIAVQQGEKGHFGINSKVWFKTITQKINLLKTIEDKLNQAILASAENLIQTATQHLINQALFLVIILLLISLMAYFMIKGITQNVAQLTKIMANVRETGNFNLRTNIEAQDEIGLIGSSFNTLMATLETNIATTNQVLTAIGQGDFKARSQATAQGDLNTLKEGVNQAAASIDFMMSELDKVMKALQNGQFDHKMDAKVPNSFKQGVESTLEGLNIVMMSIKQNVEAMAAGDFRSKPAVSCQGTLQDVSNGVANSVNALNIIINDILKVTSSAAQKDLTQRISVNTQGTFTDLKTALNSMLDSLSNFMVETQQDTLTIVDNTQKITEEMNNISAQSQRQAASLEETATALEEITSTITQTADNTQQATGFSEQAAQKVQHVAGLMKTSLESTHEVKQASAKIEEITNLIDGIAFQTNLLALNAAVEAARAGDHGRGFAVVAGEVRNLAGRSADAASQIKTLIDSTIKLIDQGVQQSEESGTAITDVVGSIQDMTNIIAEISSSSKEQAVGITQINQAVSQIDSDVQQSNHMANSALEQAEITTQTAVAVQTKINEMKVNPNNGQRRLR